MTGAPVAGSGRLVLFDFDGVLVRGDSFASWLRNVGLRPWPRRALSLLLAPIGLPLLAWLPTRALGARLFLQLAIFGAEPTAMRRSLIDYGRMLARRSDRLVAPGMEALRRHLAAGDRVVVVSGTESTLLGALLDELGIAGALVVASELHLDGRFARVRRHCFGSRKVSALAECGIRPPWDLAYSDSPSDLPLLRGAREAVCVNWRSADQALAQRMLGERARHVAWR